MKLKFKAIGVAIKAAFKMELSYPLYKVVYVGMGVIALLSIAIAI